MRLSFILGAVLAFAVLYSMCVIAGIADEDMKRMMENEKKEEEEE